MHINKNFQKKQLAAVLTFLFFIIVIGKSDAAMAIDTLKPKQKSSQTIFKTEGDKSIELKMEDGEVTSLKIDDKVIAKEEYSKYQNLIDETKPMSDSKIFGMKMDGNQNGLIIDGKELDFSELENKMKDFSKGFEKSFGKNGERIRIFSDEAIDNWQDLFGKIQRGGSSEGDSTNGRKIKIFGGGEWDMDSLANFDFKNLIDSSFMNSLKNLNFEGLGDMRIIGPGYSFDGLNEIEPRSNTLPRDRKPTGGIQAALTQQLNEDGFNVKTKDVEIEISEKMLKINGDKQPENMHKKYKKLIEIETGMEIEEGTKLNYKVMGKEKRKMIRG